MVNIFMLVFVTQLVRKWIGKEDDALSTVIKNIPKDDLGVVKYDEMGIAPIFSIVDMN